MSNSTDFEQILDDVIPLHIPYGYIHSVSFNYQNGARTRLVQHDFAHFASCGIMLSSSSIASLEEETDIINAIDIVIDHNKLENDVRTDVSELFAKHFI